MINRFRVGGVVLIAVLATWFFLSKESAKPDSLKIGVVLPLSGSMAEYGENARRGLSLALDEIAIAKPARKVELIYQDSREQPQDTVTAVHRLIDIEGVKFIIGGLTSSGVLASAPYAQEKGVLFFTPAASAPGIPTIGDKIFRNWPGDDAIASAYGTAMYDRGVRSVAIFSVSNDYGQTNAKGFALAFQKKGGKVALERSFAQGTTEFKGLASLAANTEVDRILVVGYPDEYRAFFQEIGKLSISPAKVLVSDTFYSPKLLAEIGTLSEGSILAVAAKPGDEYQPRKQFIEAYRAHFKTRDGAPISPGLVSDTAYDALKLLVEAVDKTDGSPIAVSGYLLRNVKNYPGVAGPTTFDGVGDVTGEMALYQVHAGEFKPAP